MMGPNFDCFYSRNMIRKPLAARSKRELGNAKFILGIWIILCVLFGINGEHWVGIHMPSFGATLIYVVVSLTLIGIVHFPRDNYGFYLLMALGVAGAPFVSVLVPMVGTAGRLILVVSFFYCCFNPRVIRGLIKKYGGGEKGA